METHFLLKGTEAFSHSAHLKLGTVTKNRRIFRNHVFVLNLVHKTDRDEILVSKPMFLRLGNLLVTCKSVWDYCFTQNPHTASNQTIGNHDLCLTVYFNDKYDIIYGLLVHEITFVMSPRHLFPHKRCI